MVYLAYRGGCMTTIKNSFDKNILINLIGIMISINEEQRNDLKLLTTDELEHKYKLLIKEKSEEML